MLYSNPAGGGLLEHLVPDGQRESGLRAWPRGVHALPLDSAGDEEPVTRRLTDGATTYDLRFSPVRDSQASAVAHVLVARDVTEQLRVEEELRATGAQLEQAFDATVKALSAAVESRDPYTLGHQRRVAALAQAIGAELGLEAELLRGLLVAAEVHDVGKIQVPIEILSRPGRLTAVEFEIVKQHAEAGYQILKGIAFP